MDAATTAQRVRTGRSKAVDVVSAAIDAALDTHDQLNAFTLIDRSGAIARAEAIDALIAAGKDPGPLAGVPIALKDLIDQTGLPNTMGGSFPAPLSEKSATVVRRLGDAGGVIIGRTGLHEFAFGFTSENPWFGPVRNPWDTDTSAGGSSGGSSAAVAAGVTPIGIGTDTGGSVRVPAALCGLFGLKVTHGRIPLTGVYPLAASLDTVGPIARTVADIDLAYRAMAGYDREDEWSSPRDVEFEPRPTVSTIGIVKQWMGHPTSSSVTAAFSGFLDDLRQHGFDVVEVDEPTLGPHPSNSLASGVEILEVHLERFLQHRDRYGADLQVRLDQCRTGTANDVLNANRWRTTARDTIARLDRDGIGLLVSPTVGALRKVIGEDDMDVDGVLHFHRGVLAPFTAPINHIGMPALAAPLTTDSGVPTSIQLIGPMWQEHRILSVAAELEAAGLLSSESPPDYPD
jgi:Asp-tRNA(Asn)/Glu-tRNA(Gln) amidotransferase A subunit family amidase